MKRGVCKDRTREDHDDASNQLYAEYAEGVDLRKLVVVIGEEAFTENDKKFLGFAELFEKKFITQGKDENRSIDETLNLAWELLKTLPKTELKRIRKEHIEKYMHEE